MTKHTPGPWSCEESPLGREYEDWPVFWIYAPDNDDVSSIAEVRYGCGEAAEAGDCEANARLIAAAPELLEALQEVLVMLECLGSNALHAGLVGTSSWDMTAGAADIYGREDMVRAAITKATS